jgi:hypothetical protein
MGLYFRKRIGLGPLALNFSKSGIGISAGVRGLARWNLISPRPCTRPRACLAIIDPKF